MNFTPTQEQLTILQEFNNHRVMKINAVAGSGKEQPVSTSTPTPYGIVPFGSLKSVIKFSAVTANLQLLPQYSLKGLKTFTKLLFEMALKYVVA